MEYCSVEQWAVSRAETTAANWVELKDSQSVERWAVLLVALLADNWDVRWGVQKVVCLAGQMAG